MKRIGIVVASLGIAVAIYYALLYALKYSGIDVLQTDHGLDQPDSHNGVDPLRPTVDRLLCPGA